MPTLELEPVEVLIDIVHCHFEMPELPEGKALVCGIAYDVGHPLNRKTERVENLVVCENLLDLRSQVLCVMYTRASDVCWYMADREQCSDAWAWPLARV